MAMKLEELVSQLRGAYGTNLKSIVLYGSAVAGEHIAKKSDYNILVILDSVPLDRLAAVGAVLRSWSEAGNPAPMTFTSAEWKSSADVFPMEYADILERNRVLFGEDPANEVTVSRTDLRLQVEQQALGKLLHMRRAAMAAGDDGGEQLKLLEASLSTIMVVFRGVARLHGELPPQDYSELAGLVGDRAGFDPAPIQRVVKHVRGTEKLKKEDAQRVLVAYLGALERLAAYVDQFTV